jgi:DNA-binding transcriptional LysR family regulator
VTIGQPKRLIGMLLDESVDICVSTAIDLPLSSPFARVELTRFPLALIVRTGHPLTLRGQIAPQDLEAYPIVQTRPFDLDSNMQSVGAMPPKRPAVTVEDYEVLMDLIAHSDAVWPTSPIAAREGIENGRLTQIAASRLSRTHEINMTAYYLKRRTLSPLANNMLEKMKLLSSKLSPSAA